MRIVGPDEEDGEQGDEQQRGAAGGGRPGVMAGEGQSEEESGDGDKGNAGVGNVHPKQVSSGGLGEAFQAHAGGPEGDRQHQPGQGAGGGIGGAPLVGVEANERRDGGGGEGKEGENGRCLHFSCLEAYQILRG